MGLADCVKVAGCWFWVLRCSMAKGGELGCLAHLGSPGHDFSPRPLLCYSFVEIERPIWDFCGGMERGHLMKEKDAGYPLNLSLEVNNHEWSFPY